MPMDENNISGTVADDPALPVTREDCRVRIAELRDDVAAIKAQIAAADLDRQARGGRIDARWFHRAKTALRHKQRELDLVTARMATLADKRRDGFKDCLIEIVRQDYDDDEWREVLDEAHRRHAAGKEA
jgi:hypothetical protein